MTDDTSTDRSTGDPGKRHGADEAPPSIDESTIRAGLHDLASLADGSALDSSDIARRARARRRPRLIAMTAVCSLALLGVGTVGVQALQQWNGSSTVTDSAAPLATHHGHEEAEMSNGASDAQPAPDDGSAEGASGDASAPAPLRCGDPAPGAASAAAPVTVTVEAPRAEPGATAVEAAVTITNTGSSRITGWTAPLPTLVITDGARVLWHTHGAMIALAVEVDLAPGASQTFTGVFDAVSCTSDEALESGDTAPLYPGEYELVASVDLTLEDGGAIHAVSAPVALTVG